MTDGRSVLIALRDRGWAGGLLLLAVVGLLASLDPSILGAGNLANVLAQSAIVGVCAVGMTFVLLSGGIDLSVGAVLALSGAVGAWSCKELGLPVAAAWGAAVLAGLVCGLGSGALVAFGRVPPFMATLAMMAGARGCTLLMTRGYPISGLPQAFYTPGWASVAGIPVSGLIFLGMACAAWVLLQRAPYGVHLRAMGDNPETARLAGLSATRITLSVYAISGAMAGLAGVLMVGRLWSAQPNVGMGLELDVIAAVVLGGASLFGGVGGVGGTVAGVLIMGFLDNGLRMLAVSSYVQQSVKGVVFVGAVLLDLALKGYYRRDRGRDE
ncbi:MAG: ABC transporter permease [Synergistaceae bacterium]|nr:ABC transporter permease [Synergistaceae bacterium]